jgi:hypothetical protein
MGANVLARPGRHFQRPDAARPNGGRRAFDQAGLITSVLAMMSCSACFLAVNAAMM